MPHHAGPQLYPQGLGAPAQYPGQYPPPPRQASPELQMLGGLVERMMNRLDGIESKMQAPNYAPAQAPDHMQGVLQTLKMAREINEFMNPYDEEEEDGDEGEWVPKTPQDMAMMMAMRKFEQDPEGVLGTKPPAAAGGGQAGTGPRLVRASESHESNAAGPMGVPQIQAALKNLSPQELAMLINGVELTPETMAALAGMMPNQGGPSGATG